MRAAAARNTPDGEANHDAQGVALHVVARDDASASYEAWTRHMRHGEYELAWRISDAVVAARLGTQSADVPRHQQQIWDGTPLAGRRVLVRCYHGLGDTIQFARFLPRLLGLAAEVIVWAPAPLLPLLRRTRGARGVAAWLPLHDGAAGVEHDVDVEIMELAHVFRATPATLPRETPYLDVRPARLPRGRALQVGLVWQTSDWERRRSVPLPLLAPPLARVPGVALHALQRGPARTEWSTALGRDSGTDDCLRAARVIAALDLVITVDSMPAHLAGALGRPTWTLLPRPADWRWLEERDDSPWHPTMRLFRQTRDGAWDDVVARVVAALRTLAREAHGRRQRSR